MSESLFEYQLRFKKWLSDIQRAEAYKTLGSCGTWSEGMWWHPSVSRADVAKSLAKDTGFKVLNSRLADE